MAERETRMSRLHKKSKPQQDYDQYVQLDDEWEDTAYNGDVNHSAYQDEPREYSYYADNDTATSEPHDVVLQPKGKYKRPYSRKIDRFLNNALILVGVLLLLVILITFIL